jgi:Icc-related predicted phosphoesterase
MRVHAFSDLHLEFAPIEFPAAVRDGALADLVLLAGDIDVKRRAVPWAAATFKQPTALIGGNHEAYGDSLFAAIAESRRQADAASRSRQHPVRFLERESWIVSTDAGATVRILGATLWTDFAAFGDTERHRAMAEAHRQMNDFARIRIHDKLHDESRTLVPSDLLPLHGLARSFIERELAKPFDGPTIVLTHHAPSLRSVRAELLVDPLTPAYASDLEPLIGRFQPALWVHGHMHSSFDYRIGRTRVVCNPRGYAPSELNPDFDPALVVDLG